MKRISGVQIFFLSGIVFAFLVAAGLVYGFTRPVCLLAGDQGTDLLSGNRKYPFSFICTPYTAGYRVEYFSGDDNSVIEKIKTLNPSVVVLSASHSGLPEKYERDTCVRGGQCSVPEFVLFFSPGYGQGRKMFFDPEGKPVREIPPGFPVVPENVRVLIPDYGGIEAAFNADNENKKFTVLIDTSSGGNIYDRINEEVQGKSGAAIVSSVCRDFLPEGVIWFADVSFVGVSVEYLKKKSQKNQVEPFIFLPVMPKIIKKSL